MSKKAKLKQRIKKLEQLNSELIQDIYIMIDNLEGDKFIIQNKYIFMREYKRTQEEVFMFGISKQSYTDGN